MKLKDFDTIIYHGPCSDGTAGLWCANHYRPIKNRYSCKAGHNPAGDFSNQNIIFVDICPKIEYLLELVKIAKNVIILDHHRSSEQMILNNKKNLESITNLKIEFDMKRSGCEMTWDYFFDNSPRPFFINYIGDRDRWAWELPNSKEINSALYELNYIDSYNLNKLTDLLNDSENKKKDLESQGKIIELLNKRSIDIALSNAIEAKLKFKDQIFRIWLGGNISPGLRSDLGNELCKKKFIDGNVPDFSATWQFDAKTEEWWISLRGIEGISPDLSEIAALYGGGGHFLASGFTNPHCLKDVFIY